MLNHSNQKKKKNYYYNVNFFCVCHFQYFS